jgi:hypothetical protein
VSAFGVVIAKPASAMRFNSLNKAINHFSGIVFFGQPKTETSYRLGYIKGLKMVFVVTAG